MNAATMSNDPHDDALVLADALAKAGTPAEVYSALEQRVSARVGFGLFTLLVTTPAGDEVARVHSSNLTAYPLAGRKRMGPTPWGDRVLGQRLPYLGNGRAAIEWAFPDHALIASLGLSSVINVPVVAMGRVLGTVNVLGAEQAYTQDDVDLLLALAPVLVAPFLRETLAF
jgi:GAF domain-containing protein